MNNNLVPYPPYVPPTDKKGDPRLWQWLTDDPAKASIHMLHYPDDEGIKNNGGRAGAHLGPSAITSVLLKMTRPAFTTLELPRLHILGHTNPSLSHFDKLEAGRSLAKASLMAGKRWIGLGGGHDYGYCDGAGFLDSLSLDVKPLILNFDAHLDVRPLDRESITSGTPFSRLLQLDHRFEFVEVGVRDFCNSSQHAQWASEHGAKILTLDDLRDSTTKTGQPHSAIQTLSTMVDSPLKENHPCFLSVDIDVFSSSFAMGCSQSWPTGMLPWEFWPLFNWALETFDVRALGVYEVSPPLDHDHRTSKLAAEIVYHYITKAADRGTPQ